MRNELWKAVTRQGFDEATIKQLEYVPAVSGSPYDEAIYTGKHQVMVNPYIRYGEVLATLLADSTFMDSQEGRLLFHEAMSVLVDVERISGIDEDYFLKKQIEKELLKKQFGEEIYQFYQLLTVREQKRTLENLLFFYRHKQTVTTFVKEVVALYPQSMLFQKKGVRGHIYIFMGVPRTREIQWKLERCKDLFLPMETQLHIAWERAFLLTDMQRLEANGKSIV